jgi:hypothetical protein
MLHIKLTSANAHCRRPCLTCGAQQDDVRIVGQVFESDQAMGRDICPRCLGNPIAIIADMRQRIEGCRAAAARRRESTVNFSTYPSLEEFKRAIVAANESYRQLGSADTFIECVSHRASQKKLSDEPLYPFWVDKSRRRCRGCQPFPVFIEGGIDR